MKAVIYTQYEENYGEDGHDYWKNKGGDTYIMDVSVEEAMSEGFWDELYDLISYRNGASAEYVMTSELVDDIDFDKVYICEIWETPIYLHRSECGKNVFATRVQTAGEYTYWKDHIEQKRETWTCVKNAYEANRVDYILTYLAKDGNILNWKGEPLGIQRVA